LKEDGKRVLFAVIHCIPIPILRKATMSESLIIPVALDGNLRVKQVYRALNSYFQDNLDQRGLFFIKNSTKLILSDTNHQVFQCKDEQVFEMIY